ncbi:MAG: type II toxin-antitoxin system HicB family antitoxin, partial [Geminicoccaceae bacterium]
DGVGFHADTVESLRDAFHEAVEDYIETCAKIGKEPQKAFSGQVMFRVDPEVHRKAALAAELSGKSLNQWAEEVLDRAAR